MRLWLEYPIYPIYFEELEGKSLTTELRLPISRQGCVYYSPEAVIPEKVLNEFYEAYKDFVEGLLLNSTPALHENTRVKTAFLSYCARGFANESNYSYLNPLNWVYGNSLFNEEKINLFKERYETLKREHGKCISIIFYKNGVDEEFLKQLKSELEKNISGEEIVFLNSDLLDSETDRKIVDLMVLSGSRAVPFLGTLTFSKVNEN